MLNALRDPNKVPITFISSAAQLHLLADALEKSIRVSADTETNDRIVRYDGMWMNLRVIAIAVKLAPGEYHVFVVDFRDVPAADLAPVIAMIEVADGWNANFDDEVCDLAGIPVKRWKDAQYTDGVLHAGAAGFDWWHGLAWATLRYLGIEVAGKGTTQKSYDAVTDLTDEQIRYAGLDTLYTMWVAEVLEELIKEAGLEEADREEQGARRFINKMTYHGMHFDSVGWNDGELVQRRIDLDAALGEIAELTGGAELVLFGDAKPTWDVNSPGPLRDALNKWAASEVKAANGGRLLEATDKLDDVMLKGIDHPLSKELLKYREHFKVLSTYGENLDKFVDSSGRLHSRYMQGGVVATGRLASRDPNAQNFAPAMKPYLKPDNRVVGPRGPRVFVLGDLSQAEVRVLAHLAQEPNLISLFKAGGDFHTLNAGKMFQVDMDELQRIAEDTFDKYRTTTKGISFGVPYGLAGASMASTLTNNYGVPTTIHEANAHIKAYLEANPYVDAYLATRDKFVKDLAANPPHVDWVASFELYEIRRKGDAKRRSFKNDNGRYPSMLELAIAIMGDGEVADALEPRLGRVPIEADVRAERDRQVAELTWAYSFDAPAVLMHSGQPFAFEGRTETGRRRLYMVPIDRVSKGAKGKFEGIITEVILTVATTDKDGGAKMRDDFAARYKLDLPTGTNRCPQKPGESRQDYRERSNAFRNNEREKVLKAFEGKNRWLRYELVKFLTAKMGQDAFERFLLQPAFGQQLRKLVNQFRNQPMQGLVADIMLGAMAQIDERLDEFEDAFPVQQVHDSVGIECYLTDAPRIMAIVKQQLEDAMGKWCSTVPAKADVDVAWSLAKKDKIKPDELERLVAEATASV